MTEHINIPELADTLTERTAHASWVVVFKALVTCHHLMVYGHEVRQILNIIIKLVFYCRIQ